MTLNAPSQTYRSAASVVNQASEQAAPQMRRVDIMHLTSDGDLCEFSQIVPATAPFEDAFSAFARGTIMQTGSGPKAIEDILPGDALHIAGGGTARLLWRGSMMIVPGQDTRTSAATLTRINADAFGLERPAADLVLGPRARISYRAPAIRTLTGQDCAFVPAADFIDGMQVIELTPPSAVQVFHLGFNIQHCITANGIEVETFHPGPAHALGLRHDMLQLYLSLFPHIRDLAGFGPQAQPRLRKADLDLVDTA